MRVLGRIDEVEFGVVGRSEELVKLLLARLVALNLTPPDGAVDGEMVRPDADNGAVLAV